MANAALVLSGCGVFDGSEIHEAVAVLFHLSRLGSRATCFAPDKPQLHVVDHATGKSVDEATRSVLSESARISRGQIHPITELRVPNYDAVFFPGGFGAAKNLSDFAAAGKGCSVDSEVARVIREFHRAGKPIGLCCIAPVLVACVLGTSAGGSGVSLTIGEDAETSHAIEAMGGKHVRTPVTASHVDELNRIITTPAYMYDAPIHRVFEGIGSMVESTLARVPGRKMRI